MLLPLDIFGVIVVTPKRFADDRGYVSEVYVDAWAAELGLSGPFVQENESHSLKAGTVRGLHFQLAPHAQAKLVRCVRGSIFDVAVDLRAGSSTYGQHVTRELSAANGEQLFVPEGFAHGFCTLEPDTMVIYKLSSPYRPGSEGGVLWNDPDLGIKWPVSEANAVLSGRDSQQPRLSQLPRP